MSVLESDAVRAATGTNTDLTLAGKGTGVPDLAAGFKVGSVAGVPTASIRDDAVTLAKLASGTDGELITWDASGDPAAVAVGTATHILTSNGAGAAPTFQAAAASGVWTLITTATPSAATEVAFTSLSSAYKIYRFVFTSLTFASVGEIRMRTSTDNGSSYDSSDGDYCYSNTSFAPLGTTSSALPPVTDRFAAGTATTSQYMRLMYQFAATAGSGLTGGELTMYNPSNTTIYKTSSWNFVGTQDTPLMYNSLGFGCRMSTADIDAVKFYVAAGNFSGNIYLYGLT